MWDMNGKGYQSNQNHAVIRFSALHYPDSSVQTCENEACCQACENDADGHGLGTAMGHVWAGVRHVALVLFTSDNCSFDERAGLYSGCAFLGSRFKESRG